MTRPRKAPALLEDGQMVACAHDWLGMSANAAHWLRFDRGPLWYCPRCDSYTRSSELVGTLTFTQVAS
jgi:hypothetical protein